MRAIDLREQVRTAIRSEWGAFAQDHPRLAAVLDEASLVEVVTEELSRDEDYQRVMREADAVSYGAEAVVGFVRRFVKEAMRKIGW